MRFKKFMIVFAILFVAAASAFVDLTKQNMDRAIDKSKLKHPHLYFSEKDKPAMLQRVENYPECRDIMNRLLSEANRLMYTPVEQIIPSQGNNTRAGWSEYDNDGKFGDYFYSN